MRSSRYWVHCSFVFTSANAFDSRRFASCMRFRASAHIILGMSLARGSSFGKTFGSTSLKSAATDATAAHARSSAERERMRVPRGVMVTGLPPCATEDGPSGAKTKTGEPLVFRRGAAGVRSTGREPCVVSDLFRGYDEPELVLGAG